MKPSAVLWTTFAAIGTAYLAKRAVACATLRRRHDTIDCIATNAVIERRPGPSSPIRPCDDSFTAITTTAATVTITTTTTTTITPATNSPDADADADELQKVAVATARRPLSSSGDDDGRDDLNVGRGVNSLSGAAVGIAALMWLL